MKKMVIFDTAVGSSNNGDEIIMDSIYKQMKDIFNSGYSSRLATHINNFGFLQMLRNGMKVKYYKSADWKFICGTNLIQQHRIGKINPQWIITLSNIPIYKNCILIGAGATDGSLKLDYLARFLYSKVISREYIHSVRDMQAKMLLDSLGVKSVNTGCPTLWGLSSEHCKTIPRRKADNCVISVSGYVDLIDRKNDQLLVDIINENYKKKYIWIQTTEDEKYFDSLKNVGNFYKIYSLPSYSKILSSGNIDYVGSRLHGGVYALQHRVRSFIICVDHRAKGFHENNNIPALEREDTFAKLENMINDELIVDIRLNEKNINLFKSQFV